MKLRSLALSLLLSAGALALVPSAQAADAVALDPCPEYDISGGVLFDVRTDYDPATETCHVWLGLIDAYRLCGNVAGLSPRQLREDVTLAGATGDPRTVHLVVNYCVPSLDCTCDPIVTLDDLLHGSASVQPPIYCVMAPCGPYPPPAFSWCNIEAATPDGSPYTTVNPREAVWGTDAGCDIDVESAWSCAPPSGFWVDRTAGPVHVRVLVCDGGLGGLVQRILEAIGPIVAA